VTTPTAAPLPETQRLTRRLERERSARLQAEAIAERSLRQLYQRQQEILLLGAVAEAANTAAVDDAMRLALEKVGAHTEWPVGHLCVATPAESGVEMTSTAVWYLRDHTRFTIFREATETRRFPSGVGLPGRVLATGRPAWITDVTADTNFPRAHAATLTGLHSAFAFPVMVGSDVAAVLEFFSEKTLPPDDALLRIMADVGTQLGRAIERQRAQDRLIHDAFHDALTNLPNRALFLERLENAVRRALRNPRFRFAVLFLDVDRFKVVNDSLGHPAGDQLIVEIAQRLTTCLRRTDMVARPQRGVPAGAAGTDTVARLGGDEFTILLEDIRDVSDAIRVADRIERELALPFVVAGQEIFVSASIGIAPSVTGYAVAQDILRDADIAMYRAKAQGKARWEVFDQQMHARAVARLRLETELRRAVERNEFCLHYQPIVSLTDASIRGFEALVRWQHPDRGLLSPQEFIAVAEETGLILFLGKWVLHEACRQARAWQEKFPRTPPLTMSVNISAKQFNQHNVLDQIAEIVRATNVARDTLKLELTESVAMEDPERTRRLLLELQDLGVHLSIDDFGTGYSSLSYLRRFPVDTLKIDRSFVMHMDRDEENREIVRTIIALARNLGMEVIAEGAETPEQVTALRDLSCQYGQGYVFSHPTDSAAAEKLLGASVSAVTR
jgi:predicted signal transduction protein with EAL and GGDEF domain